MSSNGTRSSHDTPSIQGRFLQGRQGLHGIVLHEWIFHVFQHEDGPSMRQEGRGRIRNGFRLGPLFLARGCG
eukprot:scaffold71170_cov54-Attheya_sp.AAC.3